MVSVLFSVFIPHRLLMKRLFSVQCYSAHSQREVDKQEIKLKQTDSHCLNLLLSSESNEKHLPPHLEFKTVLSCFYRTTSCSVFIREGGGGVRTAAAQTVFSFKLKDHIISSTESNLETKLINCDRESKLLFDCLSSEICPSVFCFTSILNSFILITHQIFTVIQKQKVSCSDKT